MKNKVFMDDEGYRHEVLYDEFGKVVSDKRFDKENKARTVFVTPFWLYLISDLIKRTSLSAKVFMKKESLPDAKSIL